MKINIADQKDFIVNWCEKHSGFDCLTVDFQEAFGGEFGGRHRRCSYANVNEKAMRLAARMVKEGILKRFKSCRGHEDKSLPNWVWSYSLAQHSTDEQKALLDELVGEKGKP